MFLIWDIIFHGIEKYSSLRNEKKKNNNNINILLLSIKIMKI